MRRWTPLPAVLAAVALALVGAACSEGQASPAGGVEAAQSSTTTTFRAATPDRPLSVVLAGDSVMDDLADALVPALQGGGEAVVSHTWLLGLTRDAASQQALDRTVAETQADLIVVLMGVWELDPLEGEIGTPGWQGRYAESILDPLIDRMTVGGAHVLWLGMPATADANVVRDLDLLDEAYAALDRRDPRVSFVDLGDHVDGPGGTYAEFVPNPDPTTLVRLRQTDGLHFCPDGTVRAVEPVLDLIGARWSVPLAPRWQEGEWRASQGVEDGEDRCPE